MILDLEQFIARGLPDWRRLEELLDQVAERPGGSLSLAEAAELRLLYHRASADLNRAEQGSADHALAAYLGALVARAYAEVYARRRHPRRELWRPLRDFARRVPLVFRRHLALFWLALGLTLAGCAFGALAVNRDPAAVNLLLPAEYLRNPAARVANEANMRPLLTPAHEAQLSATVITNNIRVSLLAFALGLTLGLGTGLLLFVNGVLLGAVAAQYAGAGFGWFVAGWLLPHGAFEIPSVLIAGQAGFLLARLLIGGGRAPRWQRVRAALPELLTLLGALALLLLWAGLMEGFFSQHHAPEIAESVKVAVGMAELILLGAYLFLYGREAPVPPAAEARA